MPLNDPAGNPIFLTGSWIGSGDPNALPNPSVYLLRQTNSCLVWVGMSANDGEALGESWVETFTGEIRADFTVVGLWDAVPDGGRGAITVDIVPVSSGGGYEVELALAESAGSVHHTKSWVREDAD